MNERLKELMLEAGYSAPHIALRAQQLAELIVKECATVQHKRFCEQGDVSWDILMHHFGVEESPTLICPKCGVDRFKTKCGLSDIFNCAMRGEAL